MAGPALSVEEADEEKKAQEHIEEIRKKLREAQKVDLAFLLDATGSMRPSIKAVKEKIVEIAAGVKEAFPKEGELRFACAFYRDYDADEEPRYERSGICCQFTTDVRVFQKQMEGLEAWGGADDPEDVFSGLERLLDLQWMAPATRLVYHIADAPCHGSRFHDPQYAERYMDTAFKLERFRGSSSEDDPEGRKIEDILTRLAEEAKISSYTFLHIHSKKGERPKTAKMLEEFRKAKDYHKPSRVEMEECIVEMMQGGGGGREAAQKLAEMVLRAVENGVKESVVAMMDEIVNKAAAVSNNKSSGGGTIVVDAEIPRDWPTLPSRRVLCHRFAKYETVWEMLEQLRQGGPLALLANPSKVPLRVRVAPHPFTAACATRWPFHAQLQLEPTTSARPIVVKKFKDASLRIKDYADPCNNPYLEVMETYAIASQFVVQFYADLETKAMKDRVKMVYLDPPLAACKVAHSTECFTIENFHSNAQWINIDKKSDYYETLQTLSHWTHVTSEELLMVIVPTLRLEGGTLDKAPRAMLSDPTIHSEGYSRRFKRTNKGEVGIKHFLSNHKCNDLCKVLGLEESK